jgi:muramoyltetrapeptide carboxypeptidase
MITKPERLRRGDCIGIVAPASPERSAGRVERGVRYLEKLGYRVIMGKHIEKRNGYLAGTDAQRAEDINKMFADKRVKAIFSTRGGYGTPRILPLLDYKLIARNPKIFVGFSDITAINLALLEKAKLVSFNGALPGVDFWKDDINPFTEDYFWRVLTSPEPLGKLSNDNRISLKKLHGGNAEGLVVGGNLCMSASLMGTPYFPRVKNMLLVLEDVTEEPYRVDRMLCQLKNAGVFARAKGIVFGEFAHCEPENKESQTVEEVMQEYAANLKLPTLGGLPYGHIAKKFTLPIGVKVKINATKRVIDFIEAGVR